MNCPIDADAAWTNQIALISPPWPIFNRPSIQLGTLAAYLKNRYPELRVQSHHFFLQVALAVGYPVYQAVSEHMWPAECLYAALLYPERRDSIAALFAKTARKTDVLRDADFGGLTRRIRAATDRFLDRVDWPEFGLAGISVCLCQLTASLYLAREIKKRAPALPVIAGGSIMGGDGAGEYLEAFPELDMVVCGEGERPLARLVDHLRAGGRAGDFPGGAGFAVRGGTGSGRAVRFLQLDDLSALPMPDFDAYFALLNRFPEDKRFFPTLPAEISRGCWWRRRDPATGEKGCAFCSLNLQWKGYRQKPPAQTCAEVTAMAARHQVLSVAFMDNSLPPGRSREIFSQLAESGMEFRIFSEIRASADRDTLALFCRAGVADVQIGIEALSDSLLKKLNKGTSVIENLAVMKHCEALGIKAGSNLILHFPGSASTEVEETLRAIRFARLFHPLRTVGFWLGLDSPVCRHPGAYGIRSVFNHPNYRHLFPADVCRRVRFMIQDYTGDKTYQKKLWKPVERAVREWRESYQELHAEPMAGPVLSYQDGGGFLILRRRRPGSAPETHRLSGTSRKIYRFCDTVRSLDAICRRFPGFSEAEIRSFLELMQEKGLLFGSGEKYLSLAIPFRRG